MLKLVFSLLVLWPESVFPFPCYNALLFRMIAEDSGRIIRSRSDGKCGLDLFVQRGLGLALNTCSVYVYENEGDRRITQCLCVCKLTNAWFFLFSAIVAPVKKKIQVHLINNILELFYLEEWQYFPPKNYVLTLYMLDYFSYYSI